MNEQTLYPTLNGLFVALGAVVAILGVFLHEKRKEKPVGYLTYLAPVCLVFGFLGSRLFYTVFCDALYLESSEKWRFMEGGYSLIGCAVGVILAVLAYVLIVGKRKMFLEITDALAGPAALAIAVGRMGSVFVEDCMGEAVSKASHAVFPVSMYCNGSEEYRYALFFWEAVGCVLIWLAVRFPAEKARHKGAESFVFTLLYCTLRTFLESLRTDSIYMGFVRVSQAFCAVAVVVLFVFTAIKLVRVSKFSYVYPVIWAAFIAAFVIGFTAMFYMGSDAAELNTVKLLVSVLLMVAAAALQYALYVWLYKVRRRSKRRKKAKKNDHTIIMKPVQKNGKQH